MFVASVREQTVQTAGAMLSAQKCDLGLIKPLSS
jgi:hypothetical protein